MRTMISAMILAAGLGLANIPSAMAAPVGSGIQGAGLESVVEQIQYWGVAAASGCVAPARTKSNAAK